MRVRWEPQALNNDGLPTLWICHVLEHFSHPVRALEKLRDVLKKAGSLTTIEGDHGSCYFHPASEDALRAWHCLIEVQARLEGNSLIGRQLFPLLSQAGFRDIRVSPRMVYIDQSKPDLMDGFVEKTIIPMVRGVRARALEMGLMDEASWDRGIADLYEVAHGPNGTFCYTFFKGTGIK